MTDDLDRAILGVLASDGRISLKDLAERVGLSSPSVTDRMRRLQDRRVIRGFTVEVDPAALGYGLQAIVRIKPLPGKLPIVQTLIEAIPEFTECDKVTGDDCFVARLHVRSVEHLDRVLEPITDTAETSTAIVKSSPIPRRLPPL